MAAVAAWVNNNGYKPDGHCLTGYHISPHETKNPQEFVTEVMLPCAQKVKLAAKAFSFRLSDNTLAACFYGSITSALASISWHRAMNSRADWVRNLCR